MREVKVKEEVKKAHEIQKEVRNNRIIKSLVKKDLEGLESWIDNSQMSDRELIKLLAIAVMGLYNRQG